MEERGRVSIVSGGGSRSVKTFVGRGVGCPMTKRDFREIPGVDVEAGVGDECAAADGG